jgi:hypothetical protein
MPPPAGRTSRNFQTVMNQNAARDRIIETVKNLAALPIDEVLPTLRASERLLSASKPPLQ